MNLYESRIYGKPREIIKMLIAEGPQYKLSSIARAIGRPIDETLDYWRELERQGIVERKMGGSISYALKRRISTGEADKKRPAKPKSPHMEGDKISDILAFLEDFTGEEFSAADIAEEVEGKPSYISKLLIRLARNGLVHGRHENKKTIMYRSGDGLMAEVIQYLRLFPTYKHMAVHIAGAIGRSPEGVRMVLRALHYQGKVSQTSVRGNKQLFWQWRGDNE